jgi:hypothetical protein
MRCHMPRATAAILLASGLVAGQTPPGTNPATTQHLDVQYSSTQLMANEQLLQTCMYNLRPLRNDELTFNSGGNATYSLTERDTQWHTHGDAC